MSQNVSSPIRSPLDSPASSVRQSLDIPAGSGIRSKSPNPRRNRTALRDYYNIQGANGSTRDVPSRTASVASTTSVATNTGPTVSTAPTSHDDVLPLLDSPDFSPESYVASLMSTSSLSSILRAESTLVSEIKNLDGERKALVYDNYSKLIRATETIAQLQKGMDDREGGGLQVVETLVPSVRKVAETAGDIQTSRQGSSGQRARERSTVQWVLDAPQRLAAMAQDGQHQLAKEEWQDVRELLDSWKAVKGTDTVRSSCEAALRQTVTE